MKCHIKKLYLIKEYIENGKSSNAIAEEMWCSGVTILNYLKKYNIKTRTNSEALTLYCKTYPNKFKGKNNGFYGRCHNKKHREACLRNNSHPNFIHGESIKSHYCKVCNEPIHWKTFRFGNQTCQRHSAKQNWKNKDYVKNQIKARNVKQNKVECKLEKLLNNLYPNQYKFIGNGKLILDGLCPDFVNINGQKKIIELYGDYWHNLQNMKQKDKKRIPTYAKYGYKTLIVWEHELKDIDKLNNRIKDFHTKEK